MTADGMIYTEGRHQAVRDVCRTLEPNPNLSGDALNIARATAVLAAEWLMVVPDGPELVVALRALRQAKDGAVVALLFPPAPSPERPVGMERPE